ncbi:hypothetical protein, partial [Aeromonas sp. Prich7-2]
SADSGVISSSEPSGISVIGSVKWKSGSSELDCQLTTGRSAHQNHQALAYSVAAGNRIIGIEKWKPATCNRVLALLKAIMTWAARAGLIKDNPAALVSLL